MERINKLDKGRNLMDQLIEYEQSIASNVSEDSVANKMSDKGADLIKSDRQRKVFLLAQALATENTHVTKAQENIDLLKQTIYNNKEGGDQFVGDKEVRNQIKQYISYIQSNPDHVPADLLVMDPLMEQMDKPDFISLANDTMKQELAYSLDRLKEALSY